MGIFNRPLQGFSLHLGARDEAVDMDKGQLKGEMDPSLERACKVIAASKGIQPDLSSISGLIVEACNSAPKASFGERRATPSSSSSPPWL